MNSIEGYSLSRQQQDIWQLQQESHRVLWSTCCVRLVEHLSFDKLRESFILVAKLHEILATKFVSVEGMVYPLQVLQADPLVEFSASQLSDNCSLDDLEQPSGEDLRLYAHLYTASSGYQYLKLKAPALMMDTHALLLFSRQWLLACTGAELPDDIVQYIDYSEWQREVVGSTEAANRFWEAQPKFEMATLPGEFAMQSGKTITYRLPEGVCRLSMTETLSIWFALLQTFTRSSSVSSTILLDGKTSEAFDCALGHYANRVLCSIELSEVDSMAALFEKVEQTVGELKIFQMDKPESHQSLLPKNIGFEYYEQPDSDISIVDIQSDEPSEKLSLVCYSNATHNQYFFRYTSGMYQPAFIESLGESFSTLARQNFDGQRLDALPLLSEKQKQQIISEYNQTQKAFNETCFHLVFEEQALKTPHAIAVKSADQAVSYHSLNIQANQWAHYLTTVHKIGGHRVGVCMTRSIELLVVLLGILKAGGTYVALTPDMPPARIAQIVEETTLLITEQDLLPQIGEAAHDKVTVTFESCRTIVSGFSSDNLVLPCSPDDIAYVLYTSGSTGKPKGVEVTHRGLANYLEHSVKTYLTAVQCAIVHTSVAFDLTITCMFAPLICGKFVVMVSDGDGIEGFKDVLLSEQTSKLVKLTPSHLKALNPWITAQSKNALNIGCLVVGGEALYYKDLAPSLEMNEHIEIFNEYGPTETTVGCCIYKVTELKTGIVPIGIPIANTSLYVLNELSQPVAPWTVGELYIGGAGLAKGYLNLADVTAARFCQNPFSSAGDKLYKTGDLVRFTYENGFILEFLGRNDRQVKVRSYRIELDEIESVLLTCETVSQAVVVATESRYSETEIIAYVQGEELVSEAELRKGLREKLPEYMLPKYIKRIPSMPLTSNGKIDIKTLHTLYSGTWHSDEAFVLPGTDLEKRIAEYWKEAVQLDEVGIHDNFFDLGGDSIRGVHVIGQLKSDGYDLTVQDLFLHPTIEQLAIRCLKVKSEQEQTENDELLRMLSELEHMSDDEVAKQLEQLEKEV